MKKGFIIVLFSFFFIFSGCFEEEVDGDYEVMSTGVVKETVRIYNEETKLEEEVEVDALNVAIVVKKDDNSEDAERYCEIELEDYDYGECTYFYGKKSYEDGFTPENRFGFFRKAEGSLEPLPVE